MIDDYLYRGCRQGSSCNILAQHVRTELRFYIAAEYGGCRCNTFKERVSNDVLGNDIASRH